MWSIESNIRAPVLLNWLYSLRKSGKMLGKSRILSLFPKSLNKFNKTWALMKILYLQTDVPWRSYFSLSFSGN